MPPNDHLPSLCIINFNGRDIIPTALSAAAALKDLFAEILVVDNGSTDGSVEWIRAEYPDIAIIELAENLGAGGARNVGLKRARRDRIMFIDNDVELTAECIERLTSAMDDHRRAALAAASIVYAHMRNTVQYDGAECHFLGLQTLLDENVSIADVDPSVRKVGSMSTCCFLADRSRLPADEVFDESFFYMFEDHDFGTRVRMLGAEVLSVPDAFCYHGLGTETLSIRRLGTYSSKRVYYLIRNRWLFILKNFSLRTLFVMTPLFAFYEVSQLALSVKKGWLKEWWQAFAWILRNLRTILRERRRIQQRRVVPDREILIGGRIPFRAELTTSRFEQFSRALLDSVVRCYWLLAGWLI